MLGIGNGMQKPFYKKEFLTIVRLLSVILIIFLTFIEIKISYTFLHSKFDTKENATFLLTFIENILSLIFLISLTLYPYKLEFLAIASFIYSIQCIVFETNNPMGLCMYFLGMVVLYVRGFFIRKSKQKKIGAIIFLVLLFLFRLHFGIEIFLNTILDNIAYFLVIGVSIFLLMKFHHSQKEVVSEKTLNLADFPGLNQKDVNLLQKVLENKQYKEIAFELKRSEGTIRNRLNKVYDLLGVMDKIGFITIYSNCKIIYEETSDMVSSKKKTKR